MSRLLEPAPLALSFQFLAEIASGATTRIDLCRVIGPHRHGELLAVKRLHPHFAEDPNIASRFLDEVWMTAALKHPNVVEVANCGTDEQGTYLAVELVQGVSLARLMKTVFDTGEAFPERLIVYVASQICRGLAAAHGLRSRAGELLNVVHRDLTPGNVLLGFKGEVKIADFGLAKSALRMTRTLTGTVKGEPTYMAPEQARGDNVDRRSDLFSLGVMLFELFAGKHPWSAATDYEMVNFVATQPPADLRELRPKIDKELVAIVMCCLEKDPAARFQSADEILARLDSWLRGHGYVDGSEEALGRFVRRNAMRQMRWFERAVAGNLAAGGGAPRPGLSPASGQRAAAQDASTRFGTSSFDARGPQEATGDEATDFDVKVAAFYPQEKKTALTIRDAETVDEQSRRKPLPVNEAADEMPTIVKGDARALAGLKPPSAAQPRSRGQYPSYYSIVEEDSDQRTTSINKRLHSGALLAARSRAAQPSLPGEGEEIPTVPLASSAGDGASAAVVSSATMAPVTPSGVSVAAGGAPQQASARHASSASVPSATYKAPPAAAASAFGVPDRSPTATTPTATHIPFSEGAPRSFGANEAPGGADPGATSSREAQASAQRLQVEADRLAAETVRLREEARIAVAQADRKVAMANVTAHLASMAAEALRMTAGSGVVKATRHLEEALTLEKAMLRLGSGPLSLPPDAGVGPISSGHEQHELLAQLGLLHLESPSLLSGPAPSLRHPSGPPPRPNSSRPPPARGGLGGQGLHNPAFPHPSGTSRSNYPPPSTPQPKTLASSPVPRTGPHGIPDFSGGTGRFGGTAPMSTSEVGAAGYGAPGPAHDNGMGYPRSQPGQELGPGPSSSTVVATGQSVMQGAPMPPGAIITNVDALRFRARVQPMFMGVPRTVAFAVAAVAFGVVLAMLLALCS